MIPILKPAESVLSAFNSRPFAISAFNAALRPVSSSFKDFSFKRTETSFFRSRRSDNRKPYLTVTYQNTPTIENIHQGSPQTNSGVGNIIVDFNPVNGISRYKIRVSSSSGRFIEKEITASIVQSGTSYRFKSENVSLFYGYDGLPVDSTTVLGEGDGKYYISVGAVNKSGHTVYGEGEG